MLNEITKTQDQAHSIIQAYLFKRFPLSDKDQTFVRKCMDITKPLSNQSAIYLTSLYILATVCYR